MLANWRSQVDLRPYTTLRAGGAAEHLIQPRTLEDLAEAAIVLQRSELPTTVLGLGSNVLPSDRGVPGVTLVNRCRNIQFGADGEVLADAGASFQDVFLKAAQAGLDGFSYAVGIPGTLGGALVSNAGAYRGEVSRYLTGLEIVEAGERRWVGPEWMEFGYRDSVLRRPNPPACMLLRASFRLPRGTSSQIYETAREFQRQRIAKQPPPASAGSFFKNVHSSKLAESLEELPETLKAAGVVPAGYLIERVDLAGFRHAGAMLSRRHANFIINVGGATATSIRELANMAKHKVLDQFGVRLEEEVLYLGDWSGFQ